MVLSFLGVINPLRHCPLCVRLRGFVFSPLVHFRFSNFFSSLVVVCFLVEPIGPLLVLSKDT